MNIIEKIKQHFISGSDYSINLDGERLVTQYQRLVNLMSDGKYRTLSEIAGTLHIPESSASAQLRNCRKAVFGGHTIEKQRRGERTNGLFEYKLTINGKRD